MSIAEMACRPRLPIKYGVRRGELGVAFLPPTKSRERRTFFELHIRTLQTPTLSPWLPSLKGTMWCLGKRRPYYGRANLEFAYLAKHDGILRAPKVCESSLFRTLLMAEQEQSRWFSQFAVHLTSS